MLQAIVALTCLFPQEPDHGFETEILVAVMKKPPASVNVTTATPCSVVAKEAMVVFHEVQVGRHDF